MTFIQKDTNMNEKDEWYRLLLEAKNLGISPDEIRNFIYLSQGEAISKGQKTKND